MKSTVIKGLNEEQARIVNLQFKEATALRRRFTEILDEKIATKRKEMHSKDGYNSPSWPYYQADSLGYERALMEIMSILED